MVARYPSAVRPMILPREMSDWRLIGSIDMMRETYLVTNGTATVGEGMH
jgi:hypothetical protein